MRRTLPFLLLPALVIFLGCDTLRQSHNDAIDRQLASVAGDINKTLPMMVDKDTRFDSTAALPGKVLKYSYTMVNLSTSQIDLSRVNSGFRPQLINKVKTMPEMAPLRAQGVTFVYNYTDKDGVFITSFEIGPKDYQN